jgi:hypothetical protein
LCTPLKCRVAHPRNSLTHTYTHEGGIVIYMQLALHILVFASLTLPSFPLPTQPTAISLSLSLSLFLLLSTLEYRCLLLSLSLSIFYLRLTRCEHVHPSSSFVSDLKTEGRSIGRFSSGFSSATTTPRRVEKLLSGLPIRAWKKIQVDRTHSREKDDGKEEWERGWLAGVGWRERAAGGKGDGERRERERGREREREREKERGIEGKRVSPNEAWTSRIS